MAGTEGRLSALIDEYLAPERALSLDSGFKDFGVSSMDLIAFMRVVEREFQVIIQPEDRGQIKTFGDLVAYLDSRVG